MEEMFKYEAAYNYFKFIGPENTEKWIARVTKWTEEFNKNGFICLGVPEKITDKKILDVWKRTHSIANDYLVNYNIGVE